MSTTIHILDVGQGNMVLIEAHNGKTFVFDCNVSDANEYRVLKYIGDQIGQRKRLWAFICSHRDADHIRGIKKLHARFPIRQIWDSGLPGTTTDSSEYRSYMELRRTLGFRIIKRYTYDSYGRTMLRFLSSKDERLPRNANAQGIVIKVEHRRLDNKGVLSSAILPGDSDAQTWRFGIQEDYPKNAVSASILMASHHGSSSFFDDPDDKYYYKEHLKEISPGMTLISVGPNVHGHPDDTALRFYREYSSGSKQGAKIYRTDQQGTMKLTLKDGGGWNLKIKQ